MLSRLAARTSASLRSSKRPASIDRPPYGSWRVSNGEDFCSDYRPPAVIGSAPGSSRWADLVYSSLSLVEAAVGPLAALEQPRAGPTIVLAMRNGDHIVTVDKRQGLGNGSTMAPVPGEVGTVRPLTYGPIGQVLLAALDPQTVDEVLNRYPLEQYTPYSIMDREQFLARLPFVRNQGYALDVNEVVEGLMGVAAPILDFSGDIVGVLSLGFPSTRENDREFLDDAVRDLKQAVAEISANMGYGGEKSASVMDPDEPEVERPEPMEPEGASGLTPILSD